MADKTYSGQKGNDKLVISGKRRDVVFPPSVVDLQAEDDRRISVHTSKTEGENNLPFRQEEFPSTIESSRNGGMEFDECSLLSMDRLSLPSNQECLQDACLAISCCDSELDINTLACCLYYHPPSPMDKKFEATPIETPYQQALDAHKSSLSRPHIQEQDTSPHESLEQGNSTCVATSTSICEKQVEYRREENYKFPEMVDYEKRLKNFEKYQWPLSSPSPEKLAEAGMFYEGKRKVKLGGTEHVIEDQVVCFRCGHTFRAWQHNDDPNEEHLKIYVECFQDTLKAVRGVDLTEVCKDHELKQSEPKSRPHNQKRE